jgi:hypothetical protein
VRLWFDFIWEHIVDPKIKPWNIYGMDESGFPPSTKVQNMLLGGGEPKCNINKAVLTEKILLA